MITTHDFGPWQLSIMQTFEGNTHIVLRFAGKYMRDRKDVVIWQGSEIDLVNALKQAPRAEPAIEEKA